MAHDDLSVFQPEQRRVQEEISPLQETLFLSAHRQEAGMMRNEIFTL
jgi:hypothetical protein